MTYTISIAGSDINITCEPGERILDAVERAGYTMPYSCRKGVCESCRCVLESGSVAIVPSGARRNAQTAILTCVTVPETDIVIKPDRIEKRSGPARTRIKANVYRIEQLSPDVYALQLRLPIGQRISFSAGQYVNLLLEGGETRNYSIANPPHRNDEIQLHVRRMAGGLFSDQVLGTLKRGDQIEIELPFGLFRWSDERSRPAILLATGTGFAPLKSMIEDLIFRGEARSVHLFWGGERQPDIYASALATRWAETFPWFRFTPVLANPESDWTGARGFVQEEVLAQYEELSGHEVYACGNPLMIDQAKAALVTMRGLNPSAFFADAFVPSHIALPGTDFQAEPALAASQG